MELPSGVCGHADMVRKLSESPLDLSEVLPLHVHRFSFTGGVDQLSGMLISKFRELETALFSNSENYHAQRETLYLADLIEPPILRAKGFNSYLRQQFSGIEEDLSLNVIPDLWFELVQVKNNSFGFSGRVLGVVEIVETSDITTAKWRKIIDLAEYLDSAGDVWLCVLRREFHAAFFTCEFLGS